ncbi:MAG: membrane fusion protein (multidrug efflux system) [Pseudomonadales bacterium]|jgi:membrane fusion protein (multidrug efflux system)
MKLGPWSRTVAVCAIILLALVLFKGMQIRSGISFAESFPERSESVESALVEMLPYSETLTVLGEVAAVQRVALYSETAGRIVKVGFQSGALVDKGQILIQQDVGEEQALLSAAEASLELANSIYKRNKNLFNSNAVSEEAYDKARLDLAVVKADIVRLQSVIRKKTITAPFKGKTGIHQFEQGLVLQGNELITQLVGENDYLWVDFYVPQFYPVLNNGSAVEVQLLRNTAGNNVSDWVLAEVIASSTQVDKVNRSFQYRAKVSAAALPVGVNSGVSVKISVGEQTQVATLPATAVQQDHLGQFVFLLKADKDSDSFRAQRQNVVVASKQAGRSYIESGLSENQLVATDGAFKLYPGLLIHSQLPAPISEPADVPKPEPVSTQAAL